MIEQMHFHSKVRGTFGSSVHLTNVHLFYQMNMLFNPVISLCAEIVNRLRVGATQNCST